jgi:Abnormal spindle-like microcephaly-assoc'd, ASPM-SPD-2-Hydin/NHL repeat
MNFKKSVLCAAAAVIVTVCLTLSAAAQQGVINTIVGGGPSNMPATNANLYTPTALAFDAQGNYYIAGTNNNQVFKVNPSTVPPTLTLVAGNGISGSSGDGGPAVNAEFSGIYALAVDGANPANVYIGDFNDCTIRVVNQSTGIITSVSNPGTCLGGDGGPANLAGFQPLAFALNPLTNDLYVADYATYYYGLARIRKIAGGVPTGTVSTVAGGTAGACTGTAPYGDGGSATGPNVGFCFSYNGVSAGLALDTSVTPPNILISDGGRCVVREVIGGKIFRAAGSYSLGCGFKDSSTATNGQLTDPTQLQVQVSGTTQTVTVADTYNQVIRRFTVTATVPPSGGIMTTGAISTIAGTPQSYGFGGDGFPATTALFEYPQGVAFDASGDLFIGDSSNERVREVNQSTQIINTVAGYSLSNTTVGEVSFDNPVNNPNVPGFGVALYDPIGVFVNPATNNVLIAAGSENVVHEFLSGTAFVNTVAGNGIGGFAGDGNQGTDPGTELYNPNGVAQDSNGNTYIADTYNCVIRIVNSTGIINDFAGGSAGVQNGCGYLGDGGPATAAQLYYPQGLAVDSSNNLYIADTVNQVIREVNASTGNIATIAGNNALGYGYSGDGGLATNAMLNNPVGVAVDGANPANVYIADESNQRIRRVDGVTHVITTVAGNGANAFSGDGLATQNSVSNPQGVASDVNGNIFISDTNNSILRWVDPGGMMLTFAGNHSIGCTFIGDGGPAVSAGMCSPIGISVDASGNIYFADQQDNRIRKVNAFAGIGRSTGSLNFGLEAVGTPTANAQEVILSAIGPTTINNITTSGDFSEVDDCPNTLTAGATCAVDVYFTPTASGERAGLLTISDNGLLSQTQTVSLQGEGAALSITGTLAFGAVPLNTSSTKSVTLTNAGSTSVTIYSITLTQTTDYVFSNTSTCPLTGGALASKAKCTIVVTFTPHSTGVKKGTLVVKSNDPSSPLLLGYSGTGSSFESFTPASVTFATTVLNTNSKATKVTFKYSGTGTLTLNSLVASASYSLNTTAVTGPCNLSGTTTLTAGQSCAFNVVFKPTAINTTAGTVTASFTGDPNNSTLVLPLTGVGTEVTFSPVSLSFGNVVHGTTKSLNLTVKNVSASNTLHVTGTSFTGTYASVYSVTNNTCSSVGPSSSCILTVQFAPTAVGTLQKAVLNVADDGGGAPQLVSVTGNGT